MQTSVLKVPLWLKNEQEEEDDGQVSNTNGGGSGSDIDGERDCVDIKNDTLIKHMAQKYGRTEEDHYVRIFWFSLLDRSFQLILVILTEFKQIQQTEHSTG